MPFSITENARRHALMRREPDPVVGDETDPSRRPYEYRGTTYYLPAEMLSDPRLDVAPPTLVTSPDCASSTTFPFGQSPASSSTTNSPRATYPFVSTDRSVGSSPSSNPSVEPDDRSESSC